MKLKAIALFLIPLCITLTVIILGYLTPEYSHIDHPISNLSQIGAPYAEWMLIFGTFIPGILMIYASTIVHSITSKSIWLDGSLLAFLSGLSYTLLALTPFDPVGFTAFTSQAHLVLVMTSLIAGGFGIIQAGWQFRNIPQWRSIGNTAVVLASLSLLYVPLMFYLPYTGLSQRFFLSLLMLWFILVGVKLWKSSMNHSL